MGNYGGNGLVIAGNELNKVDTLKSLAKTVATSHDLVGQVVGNGMLTNAEEIANSPAYTEAVEVLAGYLQKMVEEKTKDEDENSEYEKSEYADEDGAEDEDEDDTCECIRCGEKYDDTEGSHLEDDDGECSFVCYDCMTATEYINL